MRAQYNDMYSIMYHSSTCNTPPTYNLPKWHSTTCKAAWCAHNRETSNNIDMSQLPAGTYTLRVTLEDGKTYSDKVVKE